MPSELEQLPVLEGYCPVHGAVQFPKPARETVTILRMAGEEDFPKRFRMVCGCIWTWTEGEQDANRT